MNDFDPTEAIRSADITSAVQQVCQIRKLKPAGGTILHMLLQDIVSNFDPNDPKDGAVLRLLCYLEWQLISIGELPSDFVYFAASHHDV